MSRKISIWREVDWFTIIIFLLLVIFGWINIYAATYNEEESGIFNMSQLYGKQFIWIVSAIILAITLLFIDNRIFFFFGRALYVVALFLLLLVLITGHVVNGAQSWFQLGPIAFQPSEFAKFSTALMLAYFIHNQNRDLQNISSAINSIGIIILPAILIMLQPDMGSVVVFLSLFIVLFREGMNPILFIAGILMLILFFVTIAFPNIIPHIAVLSVGAILLIVSTKKAKPIFVGIAIYAVTLSLFYLTKRAELFSISWEVALLLSLLPIGIIILYYAFRNNNKTLSIVFIFLLCSLLYMQCVDKVFEKLPEHQHTRIEIMLGLKSDPYGTEYNLNQSLISIGSGGLAGKGFLNGTQTKYNFVPSQSTDFIFCTVGEEWGFVGVLVVIGLYIALLLRLLQLAERQKTVFARVYGYGVAAILFIHFFINIGMTIGLVPVIGIPLPFFSYGGSSLWGFTILLFIFLNLDASRAKFF